VTLTSGKSAGGVDTTPGIRLLSLVSEYYTVR